MTVKEAQLNLTHIEFTRWLKYREVNGPLNPMLRQDRGFALLATRMSGGKMKDYMPWPNHIHKDAGKMLEKDITVENLALAFGIKTHDELGYKERKFVAKRKKIMVESTERRYVRRVENGK